jgi:putative addiction module component (TIGR02574 family)
MTRPVLESALRLPVAERIELVQAIWDSVVAEAASVPVTEEQRAELDRRLADAEANPSDERSWPEVRASLEKRSR